MTAAPVSDRSQPGSEGVLGEYLYLVSFDVPAPWWPEFSAWYENEHLTLLLRSPGWLRCRRYRADTGASFLALARHELASPAALETPQRRSAMTTAWRGRLAERDWFASKSTGLYALRRRDLPARGAE